MSAEEIRAIAAEVILRHPQPARLADTDEQTQLTAQRRAERDGTTAEAVYAAAVAESLDPFDAAAIAREARRR
ncbi:hypothetical protein N1027_10685 [Herbiconiux sp. CPCC 205763]|uniref:Antitoxin VbhA domain-containing protein n=1 Tax=Herbiconiux aconitum TaxID=2970913 RepID=A0ABT2GQU7_9MICO|nr:hypothetical protein [Herbiconiux aconitum]MCS5718599.1 hypothetical protein [Herbiconiux aconitum]